MPVVEVEATAREQGLHGSTSLGLVAKYIDDANFWRVQMGTYGKLRIGGMVDGKHWGIDSMLISAELN